ncbi:peroxin 23 [Trichoderma arundinaceum]|uniref:Peroxin 23 n=1 Tax=Trichoderma arundinaceum TaxID=490622 RepID=A0A395NXE2_TRIAR|nr:peroxin 23 [Trichoderma arundinaceum]
MSSRDDSSLGASPPSFDSHPALGAAPPPTYAAFSPVTLSATTPSRNSRRSTVLVHQKSPLLLATPPQITRALAYSHPFLLPLNTFVGLLTWSTGDPWQSFLLLSAFWAVVLYGDVVLMRAGPIVVAMGLIAGMYGRRYSPLSSSGWTEPARVTKDAAASKKAGANGGSHLEETPNGKQSGHTRARSEITNTKHQKTLDEIVDTLKEFTGRCNVLMDPLLEMTDFLSTQRTPTSATTRPALTAMFMRLLIVTPFWVALTMSPWRIITTRRVVLLAGTLVLTWHARVMRVSRAIIWRSATVRKLAGAVTGLHFESPPRTTSGDGAKVKESQMSKASSLGSSSLKVNHRRNGDVNGSKSAGVKFTFIIYENQRRWVGLGWTSSLFAYERPAWTDEHNNTVPQRDEFELPEVEDGSRMRWRWVEGSRWRVDGVPDEQGAVDYDGPEGKNGWIYYDNKWQNGRRGLDGWGRWTRRRKWYRDAELVEVDESQLPQLPHELDATETAPSIHSTSYSTANEKMRAEPVVSRPDEDQVADDLNSKVADDTISLHSTSSSRFWPTLRRRTTDRSGDSLRLDSQRQEKRRSGSQRPRRTSDVASDIVAEDDTSGIGISVALELQKQGKEGGQWGIGDEARMSLE